MLQSEAGTLFSFPTPGTTIEILAGKPLIQKTLLSTYVHPGSYESISLVLDDIYVEFDANSGAPLTLPENDTVHFSVSLTTEVDREVTVLLLFEPGASLTRNPRGRWTFFPIFLPEISIENTN